MVSFGSWLRSRALWSGACLVALLPLADLLFREVRVWGPRQPLFRRALQRVSEGAVTAALAEAARIDRMIKGIGSGDVWNEFLRLGLVLR